MQLRPHIDSKWDTLPHAIVTSDLDWNHACLDNPRGIDE